VLELGLGDRVELAGQRDHDETLAALRDSDLLLITSFTENHPLVALEALAARVPVVGYGVGGLPDIVRHEETGLLAPLLDIPRLSSLLGRSIGDASERRRLSEGCALAARELPTWPESALMFEKTLQLRFAEFMASEFRPSTPRDEPELVGLAERVLAVAPDSPMFARPHLHWKYWAPWHGSSSSRSHVLVRDGRIVAHAAVMPLSVRTRGRALTLLHPFDWMSEPSAIGSGVALLQRLAKLENGLLIVGGSEMTQRIVRPLGFRELGEVWCYAAPLAAGSDEPSRPARDSTLSLSASARPTHDECDGGTAPAPWLTFLRTPDRLQDCTGCPATPTSAYAVRSNGAPFGGFVLAAAPAQVRIAALWSRSRRAEDYAALIRLARSEAEARGAADEIVCMTNMPAEQDALVATGFRATGSAPIFLLASARDIDSDVRVGFQMLDGDVGFLHHGTPQPWL
jgi:hypothetical protein